MNPRISDELEKWAVADAAGAYMRRQISRREFLRICAMAGIGFSSYRLAHGLKIAHSTELEVPKAIRELAAAPATAITDWLRDVSKPLRGSTVRVVSEATPPSRAILELARKEFVPITGIQVEWELLPLAQVLQKITVETATRAGNYDLLYMDQAWIARFSQDTYDPREIWQQKKDLQMPNYNWDDFIPELVEHIAMYKGKMVGIVFDIPIFIMMYRKDIFEQLKLKLPKNLDEYREVIQAIHKEMAPKVYGTVGQWKSGHYSLECDWTAWLWAHGGSVFNREGAVVVNDAAGLRGLEYMLSLKPYMPPGVTTWDWSGEAEAVAQGIVGIYISWGEFFPLYDTPGKSKVVGLMEAAEPPKEYALRPRSQTGYEEKPGISHQGGSVMALSRYTKRLEAAWIFLQWITSSEQIIRGSLLGGGASPVRYSAFTDSRTKAAAKVQPGTTRHFPATLAAIKKRMGTEPHLPPWPEIANDVFAVELGKLVTGEYKSPKEAADVMKRRAEEVVRKYRR
jgi:multiple sugar transport system substrate-binding protein